MTNQKRCDVFTFCHSPSKKMPPKGQPKGGDMKCRYNGRLAGAEQLERSHHTNLVHHFTGGESGGSMCSSQMAVGQYRPLL